MSEAAERVSAALAQHPDATVVTGAGGQRMLFPGEADRMARIVLHIIDSNGGHWDR